MKKESPYERVSKFIADLIISEGLNFGYEIQIEIEDNGAEVKVIPNELEEPEVVYHVYHSDVLMDMKAATVESLTFAKIQQSAQNLANFIDFNIEEE